MIKVIVRGDNLGYSEGVNYGILKATSEGIVNNVGMMVNMFYARMGYQLIKDEEKICVGLHANISAGKPILPVESIHTLVSDSHFRSSASYRESKKDDVDRDEVRKEIGAQIEEFRSITGFLPKYLDLHAVTSDNFSLGSQDAAADYNITFVPADFSGKLVKWNKTNLKTIVESSQSDYNPMKTIKKAILNRKKGELLLFIFHPGYIDNYLYTHSSLCIPRIQEADLLCSEEIRRLFKNVNIECVRIDCLLNN